MAATRLRRGLDLGGGGRNMSVGSVIVKLAHAGPSEKSCLFHRILWLSFVEAEFVVTKGRVDSRASCGRAK